MRNLLILMFLGLSLPAIAYQEEAKERPNIILIMADDLGFETLGVNGSESYKTPHLNQLAKEGMNFTQCYSTPLCTPSRVQLMTGQYNSRNYIGFGLLDLKERTFGHYLKEAGYDNFIAGKWQLFGNKHQRELAGDRDGSLPSDAGLDNYCLWQVKQLGSRYKDPLLSTPSGDKIYEGKFGPDIFVDHIVDFIEKERDKPFFVYFPMALSHDPFVPTPDNEHFSSFEAKSKTNDPKYFGEMVGYMDKLLGKIFDTVHTSGNADNTLIIFIGDNGTDQDVVSLQNGNSIKGDKGNTTTAGTHVPMIATWKGKIKAGSVNNNLIDFTDFLPTLLEVAQLPKDQRVFSDGISFYPQLLGKRSAKRDWVFCHYAPNWGGFEHKRFIHDKSLKLYENGSIYKIDTDPMEMHPLESGQLTGNERKKITEFRTIMKEMNKQSKGI
ncbi:sulfatase-like hydrolase/transferase [Echinicola marina]|uniref:sulfatase-like hydrolase/transferase n=1 Tax=Echinicola marina TaxID=2859768 RepID=UPI001CF624B2|nr:sulfatase-like hydrolase/transferase [Echinicola marina]UCS94663.1 sulfatase-like hydrolase/transferase [Echinicola marina]